MKTIKSFQDFKLNEGTYDDMLMRYSPRLIELCKKITKLQKFIQAADEPTAGAFYEALEALMERSNLAWKDSLSRLIDSDRECNITTLADDLLRLANRGEEIHAQVNYGEDFINELYNKFIDDEEVEELD